MCRISVDLKRWLIKRELYDLTMIRHGDYAQCTQRGPSLVRFMNNMEGRQSCTFLDQIRIRTYARTVFNKRRVTLKKFSVQYISTVFVYKYCICTSRLSLQKIFRTFCSYSPRKTKINECLHSMTIYTN